jgi:fatty acid desaturase
MSHHAHFGSTADGEFLNFVRPRRFWLALLPWGAFLPYSDFLAHRPENFTPSRIATTLLTLSFNGAYAFLVYLAFGGWFTVIAMAICFPHVGFYLDRLRQFTEHNLMPLDNKNGARSLGCGFWGLLIGGGPWGSPCHWEHHLVAGIPWYQQVMVHFTVVGLLTPRQKEQFLIEPVIGFPKLSWRLLRELYTFERRPKLEEVI